MPSVVFLRAVNVGKTNRCRPAAIAKELARFDVVNIGAVGTFVVRKKASDSALRAAFSGQLPFKCEIMICPASDVAKLVSADPFAREPPRDDITRFVSVLGRPLEKRWPLPLSLPSAEEWGVRVIAIEGRFVLGLYVREMKAISYLGKLEKLLGVPATTRSWTTMEKIATVLDRD
jgi:uncharacterized protein (DUF1697 family)